MSKEVDDAVRKSWIESYEQGEVPRCAECDLGNVAASYRETLDDVRATAAAGIARETALEHRVLALEAALREIQEELNAEDYVVERKDLRRMVAALLAGRVEEGR